ncbi:MAG: mannosyltransferase family protein [Candidatus Dormibacteria bacterium]
MRALPSEGSLAGSARSVAAPFLLSRLWVGLFAYLGAARHGYLAPVAGGWAGVANPVLNPWTLFDSRNYLEIASHGYRPLTATFFPLYPLLLRLAGTDPLHQAAWGVALSSAAFAAGLALVHRLTDIEHGPVPARLAAWLLAFFPVSAVFSAVYSDALFLALLAATWLLLRRDHWGWALLPALAAGVTRNSGLVVTAALAVEWWLRSRRGWCSTPRVAAAITVAAPLAGLLAVEAYLGHRFGNPLAGVSSQQAYGRHLTLPWAPVLGDLGDLLAGRDVNAVTVLSLLTTVGAVLLVIHPRRTQSPAYPVLVLGIIAMQLVYSRTFAPYLNSSLRFLATTFPFIQLLALEAIPLLGGGPATRRRRGLLLGAGYLILCALFSFQFGDKAFVTG